MQRRNATTDEVFTHSLLIFINENILIALLYVTLIQSQYLKSFYIFCYIYYLRIYVLCNVCHEHRILSRQKISRKKVNRCLVSVYVLFQLRYKLLLCILLILQV
jgi:hypothetical protein